MVYFIIVELRCVRVTQHGSREVSCFTMCDSIIIILHLSCPPHNQNCNYATIGAAITKLNFLSAVNDQNCFVYICEVSSAPPTHSTYFNSTACMQVILELFSYHWWSLSTGTQNLVIKIIEGIKNAGKYMYILSIAAINLFF